MANPINKPSGTWKCRACGRTCAGSELYLDPSRLGAVWTCSDLSCGATCYLLTPPKEAEAELLDGRDILRYATSLGAEAKANGRKNMNGDDREDIALHGGYTKWVDIPTDMREEAIAAFYEGWRNE